MTLSHPAEKAEGIPVFLDVGGKQFRTVTSTLRSMPSTKLGAIAQEAEKTQAKSVELFFDRNPRIMNCLLDLYRTRKLHLPGHMCIAAAVEELRFWEVSLKLLQDCCWKRLESHENDEEVVAEIDKFLADPYAHFFTKDVVSWRMKIWSMMERPEHTMVSKIWRLVFSFFIFLAVLVFAFQTIPKFRSFSEAMKNTYPLLSNWSISDVQQTLDLPPMDMLAITTPDAWITCLEYVTSFFFLVDLVARLVLCPLKKRFFQQARNWLEMFIFAQTVALLVMENKVIPDKVESRSISKVEHNLFIFLGALTAFRALRIFYMARNFDYMQVLVLSARSSVKELFMLLTCVVSFVTLFGTLAYTAEIVDGLTTFPSIPSGMWWALITMTTVGYGDVYPVSVGGQVVGAVCALSGLVVIALPIAVIASKFASYHDNLSRCQQRRARAAFLERNPEFGDVGGGGGGGGGGDDDDDGDDDAVSTSAERDNLRMRGVSQSEQHETFDMCARLVTDTLNSVDGPKQWTTDDIA
ncbi:potassium voltage-gated channel protein Shaw-like [Babylonia areolata]|uniref:potassium voltage-gated channel protein Shaw-like n=1 Tax=Babylonia areolata TaxID=304850 RepID=UPI003FD54009